MSSKVPNAVRYRRSTQLAARVVDGLAFIVTPDDNKLHSLNATATCVWELASAPITPGEAAAALCARFQVEEDRALRDVQICLDDLVARQILVVE